MTLLGQPLNIKGATMRKLLLAFVVVSLLIVISLMLDVSGKVLLASTFEVHNTSEHQNLNVTVLISGESIIDESLAPNAYIKTRKNPEVDGIINVSISNSSEKRNYEFDYVTKNMNKHYKFFISDIDDVAVDVRNGFSKSVQRIYLSNQSSD